MNASDARFRMAPLPRPPSALPVEESPPVNGLESVIDETRGKKKKGKNGMVRLGTERGIETMFRTSYTVHMDLSGLADNKANIMISVNGIIISIIIASISPKIDANPWLLLPTGVLLIGCLCSMIFAVLAARPRVRSRDVALQDVRHDKASILFFGNFVHLSEEEFVQGMTTLMQHTDWLYHNMIRDIYGLGSVLARKFRLLRFSYIIFLIGLVFGVALFIAVFIAVVVAPPAMVSIGP